jgi:hypothetical protein
MSIRRFGFRSNARLELAFPIRSSSNRTKHRDTQGGVSFWKRIIRAPVLFARQPLIGADTLQAAFQCSSQVFDWHLTDQHRRAHS